jgi:KTSC domain
LERSPVNSTNVAAAGYDPPTMVLEVEFLNGNVYQYFDVPAQVYEEFRQAASPGQFLNTNIKGSYRYARM